MGRDTASENYHTYLAFIFVLFLALFIFYFYYIIINIYFIQIKYYKLFY